MTGILITGGSGFIGQALITMLSAEGHAIRATARNPSEYNAGIRHNHIEWQAFDLDADSVDYAALLDGIEVVVHLAARVHTLDRERDNFSIFQKTNVAGTERLAAAAARYGVKRFIFLSTIKVHGEKTVRNKNGQYQYLTEADAPHPLDAYAISKLQAEDALIRICHQSTMDFVILRPPLVYGPSVKANFLRLIRLVEKQLPLPLARATGLRSLLYVDNLCDAIRHCIIKPQAGNRIYLISDVDIATGELVQRIAACLNRSVRLFPVPVWLLKLAGTVTGMRATIDRLTDSLLVDSRCIRRELDWSPPVAFPQALQITVDGHRHNRG